MNAFKRFATSNAVFGVHTDTVTSTRSFFGVVIMFSPLIVGLFQTNPKKCWHIYAEKTMPSLVREAIFFQHLQIFRSFEAALTFGYICGRARKKRVVSIHV